MPSTCKMLVLDGNISSDSLVAMLNQPYIQALDCVWFEPTSVEKAGRPIHSQCLNRIHVLSPNEDELKAIVELLVATGQSKRITRDNIIENAASVGTQQSSPTMTMQDEWSAWHETRERKSWIQSLIADVLTGMIESEQYPLSFVLFRVYLLSRSELFVSCCI
jgi:hypothetical protein